jgi:FixJ family two-component response regulator
MPSDKSIVHVIDDDEAVREALTFQLGSAGIEVRTYESATALSSSRLTEISRSPWKP